MMDPQALVSEALTQLQAGQQGAAASNLRQALNALETLADGTELTVLEEDDLSREQLQMIKARTMYQMVEEIDDGKKKLLFLTNAQADLIASSPVSVQKMLDVFEIPRPSLLINLLESCGFRESTHIWSAEELGERPDLAGLLHDKPPFFTREDESEAEAMLDRFMADVLIPLAAQTRAVVLCSACPAECILSASFTRMYSVARPKWGDKAPFTVLSATNVVPDLYCNPVERPYWHEVRKQSRAWRQRDAKLSAITASRAAKVTRRQDLDPNATCLLLADVVNAKRDTVDYTSYSNLMAAIVRHLSGKVPALCIKTGFSGRQELNSSLAKTLAMAASRAQSGTPVLFLDVRKRKPLAVVEEATLTRAALIEQAKAQITELCDSMLAAGFAETFDVCTLAYLHDVLIGDGDVLTTEFGSVGGFGVRKVAATPLHEAIRLAREGASGTADVGIIPRATSTQVSETATWLTERVFSDAWQVHPSREARETAGETMHTAYAPLMFAFSTYARTLLSSQNLYHLSLQDTDGAQKLVNQLVRLDRLPPVNPLEGLLLLSDAWRDYDVAMLLAGRYKRACKLIFCAQLLLGWLVVVVAVMSHFLGDAARTNGSSVSDPSLVEGAASVTESVFFLSLAASALVSIDGMLNPKSRWRQLRSGANSLQSTVWQYRTRVGPFELEDARRDSTRPEAQLCQCLNEWRDAIVAGAGLKMTNLQRRHALSVYRHYQDHGRPDDGDDDFHSPTQPARYIELRIRTTMSFYERRIPVYTRRGMLLKLLVLLLGVASAVLARYEKLTWVTVATAAATAITSWTEFSDAARKVERYSSTIVALKKLLSWWSSLGEVQKASKESIAKLVERAESIISEEQVSWTSTTSVHGAPDAQSSTDEDEEAANGRSRRGRVAPGGED